MNRLDWRVVGLTTSFFLMTSYVICVAGDLLFEHRMYEVWLKLLPGFTWLTWPSFLLGLVETFLYGIYTGLVFVPIYNLFTGLFSQQAPRKSS